MPHLKNNLQYVLMAGGGIVLAGIIAVLVIMVRPDEAVDSAQNVDPQKAEQTITRQENNEEATAEETLPSRNDDVFSEDPTFDSVSLMKKLIFDAGLSEELQGKGPFTFFIPNNDAINALSEDELAQLRDPENRDSLASIITYHIVPGNLSLEDFSDGENIKTLEGGIVQMSVEDETYQLNDTATVVEKNINLDNGVVHIIDSVLIPDTPEEERENAESEETEEE